MKSVIKFLVILFISVSCSSERKKIAYINSYHKGYPPSDQVMQGIIERLPSDEFYLSIYYIDSKRVTSEDDLATKIDSIQNEILEFEPDVIIVSDDYAVKYLIKPYYNTNNKIPVVFCGINWSVNQYDLSFLNTTGMLEVLPLRESLVFVNQYFPGEVKLAILSENSLSERNNTALLDTLYKNLGFEPTYFLTDKFSEWKEMFIKANAEADIIYLPTNGSIKGWDQQEAITFIQEFIKKPIFTCDDFMMDYCVFGFTKVAKEQGVWAAETAKQILNGVPPSKIPVTQNRLTNTWFNSDLALTISFKPDTIWLKNSNFIRSDSN